MNALAHCAEPLCRRHNEAADEHALAGAHLIGVAAAVVDAPHDARRARSCSARLPRGAALGGSGSRSHMRWRRRSAAVTASARTLNAICLPPALR